MANFISNIFLRAREVNAVFHLHLSREQRVELNVICESCFALLTHNFRFF